MPEVAWSCDSCDSWGFCFLMHAVNILRNMRLIYKNMGNWVSAKSYFERAVQLHPDIAFDQVWVQVFEFSKFSNSIEFENGWTEFNRVRVETIQARSSSNIT